MRASLVLLVAVVASALYLVSVQYDSRRLFTELDKARAEAHRLEVEHDRLQVEKRAQATPSRVERLAREKLAMTQAMPAITTYVNYTPPAEMAARSGAPVSDGQGAGGQPAGRVSAPLPPAATVGSGGAAAQNTESTAPQALPSDTNALPGKGATVATDAGAPIGSKADALKRVPPGDGSRAATSSQGVRP